MRDPGAVLLVSCYELGHQPHGVTLPAAFLERAGFRPARLDLSQCRLDERAVRQAKVVGLSVPMHTALRLGTDAMRRIRTINPEALICAYGLYAWLNGDYLLDGLADAVIGGESEHALVSLIQDLAAGGAGNVPGVWRRGRPTAPVRERLAFPVPVRNGLPGLASYARLMRDDSESVVAYTEATRGCLHRCLHCPIPPVYGGRFFVVPPEIVLEDIRRQVMAGARHVTFGDPDFLNGPGHSLRILRALHAEFPDLSFDCTAKVEHLLRRREILPELRQLGCAFIVSAVESLSDRVLGHLAKGHSRTDVFEAVGLLRQSGHTLRPSLLPFTPWSTPDDYLELLDWAAREDLVDAIDPVQWSIRLLVPPGSALLGKAWMEPHLTGLDAEALTFRWVHPDPRMDALHEAVSTIVADAAEAGQIPEATYARVYHAAERAAGVANSGATPRGQHTRPAGPRRSAPRLSEPWFC
ncbi:MAG TPA: CUAEP/CCAEP-tail radical SAM protein [Gemmatimonadales bacterium]